MNFDALTEILNNQPHHLEDSIRDNHANEGVVFGIAKFALANGYDQLFQNQKYHFDNCIRPLIESVQCPGYTHECEPEPQECSNFIEDSDLVDFYQESISYCESCEGQASSDAHSKERFFED